MLGRQTDDENADDENIPLYYHINKDFSIPFGREEFCLVTGLRFGVQNWAECDTKERIPFRRRVFSSYLDGQPITAIDIVNMIVDQSFAQLYDDDVVSLCCLGILQLVILGVESRRVVLDWMLRLANDRVAWKKYPWGSYVWPTLYSQLRNANIKRWSPLYVVEPTNEDDVKMYSIFGYTWAFNGNMPAARLTPDDNEARSDWWISSYIVPVSFWKQLVPHFCMNDMHRLPYGTLIGWLSKEDRVRQLAMINLAHEFNDTSTAKDDLGKAYENCRDISLEQRGLIENFLKAKAELDYQMNNALLLKAAKLEKKSEIKLLGYNKFS
uniref:Phospholipase-like protein n=1 Tax=Tanacetum cinerariifolium TaxID=118510 RepID=A0A6L2JGW1_TANCI|nr:phospholipase-like protein [Tanacetum cinerariifolium]